MKKKIIDNVIVLMIQIITALVIIYFYTTIAITPKLIGIVVTCCMITTLLITGKPTLKQQNEQNGKEQAKYPKPPKELVKDVKDVGFCFGTYKGKYVGVTAKEHSNILVIGSSGCGKSSTIICSFLLAPQNREVNKMVLDLKGELALKCVPANEIRNNDNPNGKTIILDPTDRQKGYYGWDPFYMLNDASTETEVLDAMDVVAISIIPEGKGESQVWTLSARQFLRGALAYFYYVEKIRTLPDIIAAIKSKKTEEIVEQVLAGTTPGGPIYATIVNFSGMAPETLLSIDMNLSQRITKIYTNPDMQWCLGNNPRKCCPEDMLRNSIFLCIPESKLEQYGEMLFLIFNQYLNWVMSLPEKEEAPERPYMALILDETVALLAGVGANIPKLSQMLRIGSRGKGVNMLLCAQSISGLNYAIGDKEEVKDMINNMNYKYILDSCDNESSEEIIGWVGTYIRRKVSGSGERQQKNTISYDEENIITKEELMSLTKTEEAILISNKHGYMRLKKVYVFKDKYFKKLLKAVKNAKIGGKKDGKSDQD